MDYLKAYQTLISIIEEKSMQNVELVKEKHELEIDNARLKNELEGLLYEVRNLREKTPTPYPDNEDED